MSALGQASATSVSAMATTVQLNLRTLHLVPESLEREFWEQQSPHLLKLDAGMIIATFSLSVLATFDSTWKTPLSAKLLLFSSVLAHGLYVWYVPTTYKRWRRTSLDVIWLTRVFVVYLSIKPNGLRLVNQDLHGNWTTSTVAKYILLVSGTASLNLHYIGHIAPFTRVMWLQLYGLCMVAHASMWNLRTFLCLSHIQQYTFSLVRLLDDVLSFPMNLTFGPWKFKRNVHCCDCTALGLLLWLYAIVGYVLPVCIVYALERVRKQQFLAEYRRRYRLQHNVEGANKAVSKVSSFLAFCVLGYSWFALSLWLNRGSTPEV